jgi:enamine deaminase RidA (YjgF/YER057c/UK114 family)
VNTVVVNGLLRPDALIEVEATAGSSAGASLLDSERPAFAEAHCADDVVYISTIHPTDERGQVVGVGDVVEQVRQVFRNLQRVLDALGLGMQNVVKTLEMIAPGGLADYKGTGSVRREHLGPVFPAAAGILQDRVAADDDILVSYDVIASTSPPEAINPGWDRYSKLTYNPAVRAGDTLFMSGQAALDPATETAVHTGDIVAQAEYTYRNLIAVLEAAGLGPEHLVKTVEYVTPKGLARYRGTAAVRRSLLGEPFPASTGVICRSLLRREFEIEIDPMAIYPSR